MTTLFTTKFRCMTTLFTTKFRCMTTLFTTNNEMEMHLFHAKFGKGSVLTKVGSNARLCIHR